MCLTDSREFVQVTLNQKLVQNPKILNPGKIWRGSQVFGGRCAERWRHRAQQAEHAFAVFQNVVEKQLELTLQGDSGDLDTEIGQAAHPRVLGLENESFLHSLEGWKPFYESRRKGGADC